MSSAEKAGARRDVQDSAIHRSFVEKNQKSFEHALRAREYVPAGTSRALLKHPPFPFYLAHAEGVTGTDLDDNTRIDFHNNYTAQIHGHAHPRINAAVEEALTQITLADLISPVPGSIVPLISLGVDTRELDTAAEKGRG